MDWWNLHIFSIRSICCVQSSFFAVKNVAFTAYNTTNLMVTSMYPFDSWYLSIHAVHRSIFFRGFTVAIGSFSIFDLISFIDSISMILNGSPKLNRMLKKIVGLNLPESREKIVGSNLLESRKKCRPESSRIQRKNCRLECPRTR